MGRRSIVAGNIWVVSIAVIAPVRPINLKREIMYPAVDAKATPSIVTETVTIKLFHIQRRKGRSVNNSTKFDHVASAGIIASEVDNSLSPGRNEIVSTLRIG